MARLKNTPDKQRARQALAKRVREVRVDVCGEHGGPELARRLGIAPRTWNNYEMGVTVPAEVLLTLIERTSVEPAWLLRGKGEKYRTPALGLVSDHPDRSPTSYDTGLMQRLSQLLERGGFQIKVKWGKSMQE
jgi:hypothetical protein